MGAIDRVYSKPTPEALEARFLELLEDQRLREIGRWELNDHGEIVVSPVSGRHSLTQFRLGAELERQLGGTAWGEQGIRRPDGAPIVPDVLWSDDNRLFAEHQNAGLLPRAPRLCVEVPSPTNDPASLRDKCRTYLSLGAEEAWIVDPVSASAEIYASAGLQSVSALGFDFVAFWARMR